MRFDYQGHTLDFRWTLASARFSIQHVRMVIDERHTVASGFVPAAPGMGDLARQVMEDLCRQAYAAVELLDAPHLSRGGSGRGGPLP